MGDLKPALDGQEPASKGRKPYHTNDEKKKVLADDEWVKNFEELCVHCVGCDDWIKLAQVYHLQNWNKHKAKCPAITGIRLIRVVAPKKAKFTHKVSLYNSTSLQIP